MEVNVFTITTCNACSCSNSWHRQRALHHWDSSDREGEMRRKGDKERGREGRRRTESEEFCSVCFHQHKFTRHTAIISLTLSHRYHPSTSPLHGRVQTISFTSNRAGPLVTSRGINAALYAAEFGFANTDTHYKTPGFLFVSSLLHEGLPAPCTYLLLNCYNSFNINFLLSSWILRISY